MSSMQNGNHSASVTLHEKRKFKNVPPDGGWGWVITLAIAMMNTFTVRVLSAFGIIYGGFLAEIGNEASGTVILFTVYHTAMYFMGLVTNSLLKKYSYRTIGVFGAVIYFIGNFTIIFETTYAQLILSFGILQGIGLGLIFPSSFGAFNEYFLVKRNFMMSFLNLFTAATSMGIPFLAKSLMDRFGYRGTVAIFAALALNNILNMLTLQPVKWHYKKVPKSEFELEDIGKHNHSTKEIEHLSHPEEKVLFIEDSVLNKETCENELSAGVTDKNENFKNKSSFMRNILNFFEITLLKDFFYLNLAIGASFSIMSDIMFLSLLPMFLNHKNYNRTEVAFVMTLYMVSDLVGKLILTIFSAFVKIPNRYIFLFGTLFTAMLRIAFTIFDGYFELIIICFVLGMFRCTTMVTLPLVFVEYSRKKFNAAFGLYSTICGVVSLVLGQFTSIISNTYPNNDKVLIHTFTVLLLMCGIPWSLELLLCSKPKFKKKEDLLG